jgi:4-alpha-glucanotransferase
MDLNQRSSGVLLHITSLPGPHGCGDFGPGAFHFVDWLVSAGQSIWQLLPNNPVGPGNSPYQSPSAFAGSPLMVAFEPLVEKGWLKSVNLPTPAFDSNQADFGRLIPWRYSVLRDAFAGMQAVASPADKSAFTAYCKEQADWLDDYAVFTSLHQAAGGQPFWTWDRAIQKRQKKALAQVQKQYEHEIAFWKFVQWCFDTQAAALKAYANQRGVSLMGDLPIFVADNSVDVWTRPDLYELDDDFRTTVVAGCPPDDIGPMGQRWGNPLYQWKAMAKENYAWWTARVRRALAHSDVFRIDHFRGFAGYYEIPAQYQDAKIGQWKTGPGKDLFDAIRKELGPLPIVAEDLGFITPDVTQLRTYCGFPGMKILQFGFGGDATAEFLPHNYARDAVVYTGTHDNDTAVGWWNNATERERAYAGSYLACGRHDVHWAMIRSASNSIANMAVFQFQDVLGLDSTHRMNTPGTLSSANWGWRFNWSMVTGEAARVLALITAASGRGPFDRLNLP